MTVNIPQRIVTQLLAVLTKIRLIIDVDLTRVILGFAGSTKIIRRIIVVLALIIVNGADGIILLMIYLIAHIGPLLPLLNVIIFKVVLETLFIVELS